MTTTKLAPDEVLVEASANPRGDDLGDLTELAASIKAHGVLQPIIVTPNLVGDLLDESHPWRLVAGFRRLAAASLAGCKSLEAVVLEPQDVPAVALVENLQRLDLHPVVEARAIEQLRREAGRAGKPATQKKLAAMLGKSESWVQSRLALLSSPPKVLDLMVAGTVPLVAAERLREIATHSPAIAEEVAEGMAAWADETDWQQLVDDPGELLDRMDDNDGEPADDAPFLLRVWPHQNVPTEPLELDAETAGKVAGMPWHLLVFDVAAQDAARSYGCLLELAARHGRVSRYVTDKAWLREWAIGRLASYEARPAPTAAPYEPEARPKGTTKEAREERDAARLANTNLGSQLWAEFSEVEVDVDSMRAIAGLVLLGIGEGLANSLALVREEWQTAKSRGSIDYDFAGAAKRLDDELMAAKTPQQIIGTLLQAIAAARWLDTTALPVSQRYTAWEPWALNHHPGGDGHAVLGHLARYSQEVGQEVAGQHLLDLAARRRWLDREDDDEEFEGGPGATAEGGEGEGQGGTHAAPQAAAQAAQLPEGHVWCPRCGGDGGDLDDSTKDCDECEGLGHVPEPATASA